MVGPDIISPPVNIAALMITTVALPADRPQPRKASPNTTCPRNTASDGGHFTMYEVIFSSQVISTMPEVASTKLYRSVDRPSATIFSGSATVYWAYTTVP